MKMAKYLALLLFLIVLGCRVNKTPKTYLTDYNRQQTVYAKHAGVASAHPLASKVGIEILKEGGNAVDAAIAMQLALAVVYPEAGNIGGGGFMVMRLKDGTAKALDFRETAPASAFRDMYLNEKGQVDNSKSLRGHLACGVPGTIAGIFEALKYAKLPFDKLIEPAIELAEKGYIITDGIATDIGTARSNVNTRPSVFDEQHNWKPGDLFQQPELAATLKRIKKYGRKEFYQGKTAQLIVAEMKRGGGLITMKDLAAYQAKWREPYKFNYRGYEIISMPLPSSGGILMHQMLKMIEPYPIGSYAPKSVAEVNLIVEAERRAYQDRAAYLGDEDFAKIPVKKITSEEYLRNRMKDFIPRKAGKSTPLENMPAPESKETTHLTVVDAEGNVVSVTTTLNGAFGCGTVVGEAGFFLNDEMDDFSKKIGSPSGSGGIGGFYNSIEPGKRMLSSMSPTIVLKDDKFFMALGTPGGTTIPTSVSQAIINVIDFHMSGTDAVLTGKIHHEWFPDKVMLGGDFSKDTVEVLKKMGYQVFYGTACSLELIKMHNGLLEIVSQRGSAEGY